MSKTSKVSKTSNKTQYKQDIEKKIIQTFGDTLVNPLKIFIDEGPFPYQMGDQTFIDTSTDELTKISTGERDILIIRIKKNQDQNQDQDQSQDQNQDQN
jgi:hypothetical protein